MGWLNIKNLKFSFDKSKSLIGEYFLKMTSPSLLTKISNGSLSRVRMVLRISLGITTLSRVCDNWTNTGKPLDQGIFRATTCIGANNYKIYLKIGAIYSIIHISHNRRFYLWNELHCKN